MLTYLSNQFLSLIDTILIKGHPGWYDPETYLENTSNSGHEKSTHPRNLQSRNSSSDVSHLFVTGSGSLVSVERNWLMILFGNELDKAFVFVFLLLHHSSSSCCACLLAFEWVLWKEALPEWDVFFWWDDGFVNELSRLSWVIFAWIGFFFSVKVPFGILITVGKKEDKTKICLLYKGCNEKVSL